MANDILEIDWFHVRLCTDLPQDDFESLALLAHEWVYSAALRGFKSQDMDEIEARNAEDSKDLLETTLNTYEE